MRGSQLTLPHTPTPPPPPPPPPPPLCSNAESQILLSPKLAKRAQTDVCLFAFLWNLSLRLTGQ